MWRLKVVWTVLAVLLAFDSRGIAAPMHASPEKELFELIPGASHEMGGIRIELVDVVYDGRCPKEVLCGWSGLAILQVKLIETKGTRDTYLGIYGSRGSSFVMAADFDPRRPDKTYTRHKVGGLDLGNSRLLSIQELRPPRSMSGALKREEYSVVFAVTTAK